RAVALMADGDCDYLTDDVPSILGRPARSFEQFATDYAAAFSPVHATVWGNSEAIHQPIRKGALVATTTHNDSRTAHLLELMAKGDNAFNDRDFETVDTVHDPDMIAYIP